MGQLKDVLTYAHLQRRPKTGNISAVSKVLVMAPLKRMYRQKALQLRLASRRNVFSISLKVANVLCSNSTTLHNSKELLVGICKLSARTSPQVLHDAATRACKVLENNQLLLIIVIRNKRSKISISKTIPPMLKSHKTKESQLEAQRPDLIL